MKKNRLWVDTKKTKELVKKHQEGNGKGKVDFLKLKNIKNYIAIVPGLDGKPFAKKLVTHEAWSQGKLLFRIACGKNDDRTDCPVCNTFWKLRNKYGESKDEKKKGLSRKFQNTTTIYVNAVDVTKGSDYKPRVLNVPNSVYTAISHEIDDYDDANELINIDTGKVLKIVSNGKTGLAKRYEGIKFLNKQPLLIKDGKIELDEFMEQIIDLDTFDIEYSEKKAQELDLKLRKKYCQGIDLEDESDDSDYENDDVDDDEGLEDDDDMKDDDEDDDDNLDEDEKEDDDIDEDVSDDEDEDLDNGDDYEEEPPKKTKKKLSKKSKLRKK